MKLGEVGARRCQDEKNLILITGFQRLFRQNEIAIGQIRRAVYTVRATRGTNDPCGMMSVSHPLLARYR